MPPEFPLRCKSFFLDLTAVLRRRSPRLSAQAIATHRSRHSRVRLGVPCLSNGNALGGRDADAEDEAASDTSAGLLWRCELRPLILATIILLCGWSRVDAQFSTGLELVDPAIYQGIP